MTSLKSLAVALLASATWVCLFAGLVSPTDAIQGDALKYVAMVSGPVTEVPAPFCYRVGAPVLARAWPSSPEAGLMAVTLVSVALAGALWVWLGRRLGLSSLSLLLAAITAASTQGWLGFFHNPYLSDGAGALGLTAAWAAWVLENFGVALGVLAVAPLFRETAAPMALLWATHRSPRAQPQAESRGLHGRSGAVPASRLRASGAALDVNGARQAVMNAETGSDRRRHSWRYRTGVALAVAATPLITVHLWPGMPTPSSAWSSMTAVLQAKGLFGILGDALASYHALWLLAFAGIRLAPPERRRALVWPLVLTLAMAAVLSVLALNTVRMFTLALPMMALAVAELYQALSASHRRAAFALAALFVVGWFVWYPTRVLGSAVSAHKIFQYLFCAAALAASAAAAWRR